MKKILLYIPLSLMILAIGLYALLNINPLQYVSNIFGASDNAQSITWQQGSLYVDVIDVGQGDSIFIKTPNGKTMLIDSGESTAYSAVKSTLDDNNVKKLDALVATHPHSDHIGSMQKVYEDYGASKIYMSKAITTTDVYKNLLKAIDENGQKIISTKAGDIIDLDDSIKIEVLAPQDKNYDDLNDYSVVLKITYNNDSILLTGDASTVSEKEMIAKYPDKLKSNILKVGHHGSRTSSSRDFLAKVSPTYAIISVGKDNDYGHPHQETLTRLKNIGATIKRTDEDGSVKIILDGNSIKFGNN